MSKEYFVSDEALEQAYSLGIHGDVEARVIRMAKRSAPFTHDRANKRFDDFGFMIAGNVVWSIISLRDAARHSTAHRHSTRMMEGHHAH